MGNTLPNGINEKISYFEQRLVGWGGSSSLLGLSAQNLTDLTTLATQARANFNAAQAARNTAKAATVNQDNSVRALVDLGADLIKTIRAKALTTNNPAIYATAMIPPPATPSTIGAPATPTNVRASLLNTGGIELKWDGSVANATFFSVWRKNANDTTGNFIQIGTTANKFFNDETLPADAALSGGALYAVKAQRIGFESDLSEPIAVRFGTVTGTTASATSDENLRLAA